MPIPARVEKLTRLGLAMLFVGGVSAACESNSKPNATVRPTATPEVIDFPRIGEWEVGTLDQSNLSRFDENYSSGIFTKSDGTSFHFYVLDKEGKVLEQLKSIDLSPGDDTHFEFLFVELDNGDVFFVKIVNVNNNDSNQMSEIIVVGYPYQIEIPK